MKLDVIDLLTAIKKNMDLASIKKADATSIDSFKGSLCKLAEDLTKTANERQVEQAVESFFQQLGFKSGEVIAQDDKIDLALHSLKLGYNRSIIEVKSQTNKTEFLSVDNANKKALYELILYFYREVAKGNLYVHNLIATNGTEWFIFDSKSFYTKLVSGCSLYKEFENLTQFADYSKSSTFYDKAKEYLDEMDIVLPCIYVDLFKYKKPSATQIQALYKLFSRQNLLNDEVYVEHDVNDINQRFYDELLYIMGLQEVERSGKRVIEFLKTESEATLSELSVEALLDLGSLPLERGATPLERAQSFALELGITWINRLLFIKLLEGTITSYKQENEHFLTVDKVESFHDLHNLFFSVLGTTYAKRKDEYKAKFPQVPYLNSSLFELSQAEHNSIRIYALEKRILPLYGKTILKSEKKKGSQYTTLQYLIEFLKAYDFVGDGGDSGMIVNASVLGKVFEKLNGYKDGSYYTPSFVTMGICHDTIGKTVIAKFNDAYGWNCKTLGDVHNKLEDDGDSIKAYNELLNTLTIADISVGSGHFLVSALNEMVWIKSYLGILIDADGRNFKQYRFSIENDELVVRLGGQKVRYNYQDAESQRLQVTLFNEKKTIISNCLFGVDINPNSVNICCLRLWIELLKNTYYKEETNFTELEILPNIDINIKVGNSLISKLPVVVGKPKRGVNAGVEDSLKRRVREYKNAVLDYKQSRDKDAKGDLKQQIKSIKQSLVSSDSMVMLELDAAAVKQNEDAKKNGLFAHSMEWMIEFPELMDENGYFKGFDCIVGNPPYMRVQEIEKTQPKEKLYYESMYKNSTGVGAYDLAFIFVELALKLMRPGCICSYIMPHKYLNADGAETFRNWLRQETLVKRIAHFGANQLFKGATTYTCITEFSVKPADGIDLYMAPFKGNYAEEMLDASRYSRVSYESIDKAASLYGKNQWIMLPNEAQFDVFEQMYKNNRRIKTMFNVFVGLQTSKDELYVLDKNEDGSYTIPKTGATYQLEQEFFKPMLKGEDVHKWQKLSTNRYVFFPYKKPSYEPVTLDELERDYPLTYKYVMDNEKLFKSRESGKAGKMTYWYAYIYPKNKEKFEQEKLCSMELCSIGPNVTLDNSNTYHCTTVYSWLKKSDVTESYKFLLAVLNSNLIWWFLKKTGDTLSSDTRRFKTEYLNPFPMPSTPDEHKMSMVERLVESIMKDTAAGKKVSQMELKLNAMVYSLYRLTYRQMLAIDETMSAFTENQYETIFN